MVSWSVEPGQFAGEQSSVASQPSSDVFARVVRKVSFSMSEGYSPASAIGTRGGITPPEICDAIRNAATTAGTLINLRN